jgi:TatD DNase family protein
MLYRVRCSGYDAGCAEEAAVLVDVHFHPVDPDMDPDCHAVMARARAAGVGAAIAAAWDAASCLSTVALARATAGVAAAVGFHPWYVHQGWDTGLVEREAARDFVVAVGEIGLDGKIETPLEEQARAFDAQLGLAGRLGLPVIVHSRHAFDATLSAARRFPAVTGVLHSFGGSTQTAAGFLDLGYCFSFSGSVTRPEARRVHELAAYLPEDRILLETDAPSIGMQGLEARHVEPMHVPRVLAALARVRRCDIESLAAATTRNALAAFPRLSRCLALERKAAGDE